MMWIFAALPFAAWRWAVAAAMVALPELEMMIEMMINTVRRCRHGLRQRLTEEGDTML